MKISQKVLGGYFFDSHCICANNYFTAKRFDRVIAKIKWCSFFAPQCRNVQFFIRSKNRVLTFTAVRYSLHKCSEATLCLKRQFTVHVSPVSCALQFIEATKSLLPSSWDLNLVNPYSEKLCNKNCIVKTSETLIV